LFHYIYVPVASLAIVVSVQIAIANCLSSSFCQFHCCLRCVLREKLSTRNIKLLSCNIYTYIFLLFQMYLMGSTPIVSKHVLGMLGLWILFPPKYLSVPCSLYAMCSTDSSPYRSCKFLTAFDSVYNYY
jgi:hypothetical protein